MKWATQKQLTQPNLLIRALLMLIKLLLIRMVIIYCCIRMLTASASRANPKMVVRVNGNDVLGTEIASHYIRNASGHSHSSGSLVTVLNGLKSNDVITIGVSAEAASGTVNDHFPGRLVLIKKPTLPAPVITITKHQELLLYPPV